MAPLSMRKNESDAVESAEVAFADELDDDGRDVVDEFNACASSSTDVGSFVGMDEMIATAVGGSVGVVRIGLTLMGIEGMVIMGVLVAGTMGGREGGMVAAAVVGRGADVVTGDVGGNDVVDGRSVVTGATVLGGTVVVTVGGDVVVVFAVTRPTTDHEDGYNDIGGGDTYRDQGSQSI
ncbi:hypothetical protein DYB36_012841 [Aphanomyces astaci]|uniref:Uncharacterized protein n=1 Tax=Aphanomyces astaci TaxID=112090 RepID=A0A397A0F3_APHAT|nr:hypothetical protein DYB36_012841 [Aphanomyces astaci]